MGNCCCSCYYRKRRLDNVDNLNGGVSRPLQSVVNDEGEDSETVNVLGGSISQNSSPNLNHSVNITQPRNAVNTLDQPAADMSRISAEGNDFNDRSNSRLNPSSSERGSDEPMLTHSIKPFGGENHRKFSSVSSLQYSGSSSLDKEEAGLHPLQSQRRTSDSDPNNETQQEQHQDNQDDERTAHSPSLFVSSSELDLDIGEEQSGDASPSVTADSAEDLDSFYEKKRGSGVNEKIRFFSQQNISSSSSVSD